MNEAAAYVTIGDIGRYVSSGSSRWDCLDGATAWQPGGTTYHIEFAGIRESEAVFRIHSENSGYEVVRLTDLVEKIRDFRLFGDNLSKAGRSLKARSHKRHLAEREAKKNQVILQTRAKEEKARLKAAAAEAKLRRAEEERLLKERQQKIQAEEAERMRLFELERQRRLEELAKPIRAHFGSSIPDQIVLTQSLVQCLQRAIEDPDAFSTEAEHRREKENRNRRYDWHDDSESGFWGDNEKYVDQRDRFPDVATAMAILQTFNFNRLSADLNLLSNVSKWWRQAKRSEVAISVTERVRFAKEPESFPARVSRAAAICDVYGKRIDHDAKAMLDQAIEIDRDVLETQPHNQYARKQLGRALGLGGYYEAALNEIRRSNNGNPIETRRELSRILRIMKEDYRQAEFREHLEEQLDAGLLDLNEVPF